jgi:Fe2+ transport system protein FeoA
MMRPRPGKRPEPFARRAGVSPEVRRYERLIDMKIVEANQDIDVDLNSSMLSDLRTVKTGQRAVISAIQSCPKELLHKLLSMGVVEGTEVRVTQRGFFGSPINIHLLGSVLSLRSSEAAHIQVQPL